jgi:type II secretory pathway component PulM
MTLKNGGKKMLDFLDRLKMLVIRTKEKLSEPVTAPRRKVIVIGVGVIVLFIVAYVV